MLFPSIILCLLYIIGASEARLLAHGHYKKSKHVIEDCPDSSHCNINPEKPLYLIWAAEKNIPFVKMRQEQRQPISNREVTQSRNRSFSIEMNRPYRLDVWDRLTPALKERVFSAFEGDLVLPQQVIITTIHLSSKISNGSNILWFIDPDTKDRYETEILCEEQRRAKHGWQKKMRCTWIK